MHVHAPERPCSFVPDFLHSAPCGPRPRPRRTGPARSRSSSSCRFRPAAAPTSSSRVIAQRLTESRKWSVFIENIGGAGGNIGANSAAKSAPDGYTIVMGQTSNLVINPSLYPKPPYDPQNEFAAGACWSLIFPVVLRGALRAVR